MSRYIDADALKETIMDMRNHCEPSPCLPHQTFLIPDRMVADKIDAMPTVDAVPVVRCMKCRHAKQYSADGAVFWCGKNNLIKYGVFYCADGERKEKDDARTD